MRIEVPEELKGELSDAVKALHGRGYKVALVLFDGRRIFGGSNVAGDGDMALLRAYLKMREGES